MPVPFKINHLDHIGITVFDMEASCKWYEDVLGLKRYNIPEWKGVPVFMMTGTTGLALFPAKSNDRGAKRNDVRLDHFAFNVSMGAFKDARKHYEAIGVEYEFADHIHYHSIYTMDPDGHTVELTTLIGDEHEFFNQK